MAAPFATALGGDALVVEVFAGAALAVGFDNSSSESSLSESSSLSLSLAGFADALAGGSFEGGLVADFEGSSESLPLDSEEGLALGGGALDCR